MTPQLYRYPEQARYGKVLPKNKVYEQAKPSAALKERFVSEVGQITWEFKLSPETLNLPARGDLQEIQVFTLSLKKPELKQDVLRCIDEAIPHPIVFELQFGGQVRALSAFKRPNEAERGKWVVEDYFGTPWLAADSPRSPLPVALDIGGLYTALLRSWMPVPARANETLRAQVERLGRLRVLENEIARLEVKREREQQFNRKVEWHHVIRELKKELDGLR